MDWLLRIGIDQECFTIREVARECSLSVGLVQRTFGTLALLGWLKTEGLRTAKRFSLKRPRDLLAGWIEWYSIVKKCHMWGYRSMCSDRSGLLKRLKHPGIQSKVALALHSAVEVYGCKNTNLNTLELYMLDPEVKEKLEVVFELEPQEKGYEVLLITPYYKHLLNLSREKSSLVSSPLLTFLDLYHFPLRGREQAEFMRERISDLKRIDR